MVLSIFFLPLLLPCAVSATLVAVTPVEKVVQLLTDLRGEVAQGGTQEAGTYDTFACFCKQTTATKSSSITDTQGLIDQDAATAEADYNDIQTSTKEVVERKKKQEDLGKQLDAAVDRCLAEATEFEIMLAELTKAIGSLDKAITALENSKPAAFLQQSDVLQDLPATAKALLQQKNLLKLDPEDPAYKFRSVGVLTMLKQLKTDFTTKQGEKEGERDSAKTACDELKGGYTSQMQANEAAITPLEQSIGTKKTSLATVRESLARKEEELKDDQLYLRDLTQRCEESAQHWDQRSKARADELQALDEALAILTQGGNGRKSVQELDTVNNRSVLLQKGQKQQRPHAFAGPVSFLQEGRLARLGRRSPRLAAAVVAAVPHRRVQEAVPHSSGREKVLELVSHEGNRLHSQLLLSLSLKMASDPFVEVKQIIQQLIQRLLDEAAQEATKKGFCDTEVGKARNTRDYRFADIKTVTVELTSLNARKDELNESIEELQEAIPELYKTLNESATLRVQEKTENLETQKLAAEGVEAVAEAITILKVYYKSAANAQSLLQASPVDADTEGAGFTGMYRGRQESSRGIIGILEVIRSDFDRTVRQTAQREREAQAAFVEFERISKSDISAKETTMELELQDLKTTKNAIEKKIGDLTTTQKLLDDALRALESLKPMCIDTGMTYTERAAKRQEEIDALKKAVCFLDPNCDSPSL